MSYLQIFMGKCYFTYHTGTIMMFALLYVCKRTAFMIDELGVSDDVLCANIVMLVSSNFNN